MDNLSRTSRKKKHQDGTFNTRQTSRFTVFIEFEEYSRLNCGMRNKNESTVIRVYRNPKIGLLPFEIFDEDYEIDNIYHSNELGLVCYSNILNGVHFHVGHKIVRLLHLFNKDGIAKMYDVILDEPDF